MKRALAIASVMLAACLCGAWTARTTIPAALVATQSSASVPWTPADLGANLLCWLDASDSSTLWADTNATTAATSTVARWNDKTANDRDWIKEGGFPVLSSGYIKGSNTNCLRYTAANLWAGTNGMIFTVGRQAGQYSAWGNISVRAPASGYGSHMPFNATAAYESFLIGDRYSFNPGRNLTGTPGTSVLYCAANTGTRAEAWVDGTRVYDGAGIFTQPGATNQYLLAQSMATPLSAGSFHELKEVVMTPYLSSTDRQLLEGYLAQRHGLAGYLPTNHPYKSAPPTK
jgi:hypothetical protein